MQLRYDPETGIFSRVVVKNSRYASDKAKPVGCLNDSGYLLISINSKQHRAHRLAWLYMTGEWPRGEIDHINSVRADNRWQNLRDVPAAVNAQNKRRAQRNSKTGLLGASWSERDGRFVARIKVDGEYKSLGGFDSAEDAHAAYVQAKRAEHIGCTI